jgi:hypothetical protein
MGGANTQTPQPAGMTDAEKEAATYRQLEKQGMSGMTDESPQHYAQIAKSIYGELRNRATQLSPNLFGRDASAPTVDNTQNK